MERFPILAQQIIAFIPTLLVGVLIFVAFWFGTLIVRAAIHHIGKRSSLNEEVRDLAEDIARTTMIILGAITALGTIGVDVSALVAGLGLTGFALGFALQDIVANTLAGVLILTYRPFRRGNYIRVGGHEGTVVDIDLRYTTLRTEGQRVLIPNSTLFKEAITVAEPPSPPPAPRSLPGQP